MNNSIQTPERQYNIMSKPPLSIENSRNLPHSEPLRPQILDKSEERERIPYTPNPLS